MKFLKSRKKDAQTQDQPAHNPVVISPDSAPTDPSVVHIDPEGSKSVVYTAGSTQKLGSSRLASITSRFTKFRLFHMPASLIVVVLVAFIGTGTLLYSRAATSSCAAVTYSGLSAGTTITFSFDKAYNCGQFANGDWWVTPNAGDAGVKITNITPDYSSGRNGWEVNPTSHGVQGLDDRISEGRIPEATWDPAKIPALPYTATANQSIVKAVSRSTSESPCRSCLQTAAVLTVLGSVPENNGADFFRPPYVGTNKQLYRVSVLQTQLLPNLAPVADMPSLDQIYERFRKVQLDHRDSAGSVNTRPLENYGNDPNEYYGPNVSRSLGDGALRLMINDPLDMNDPDNARRKALIAYVQAGIEHYSFIVNGQRWGAGDGEQPGMKMPATFAAVMLNDQTMKDTVRNTDMYDEEIITPGQDGRPLFGESVGTAISGEYSEGSYWDVVNDRGGNRTLADPYGYIDGGAAPGEVYQDCCTSTTFKGTALAMKFMPQLYQAWPNANLAKYAERWVTTGAWAQPDPCAPLSQGGGPVARSSSTQPPKCVTDPDWDTANNRCKAGLICGRHPQNHNTNADNKDTMDGGVRTRYSMFMRSMWNTHWTNFPAPWASGTPAPSPTPTPTPEPAPTTGCTKTASSGATLTTVFNGAAAGDVICLSAGNYGTFNGGLKAGVVTIKPATGVAKAAVTMVINFNPASNVTIDGVTITYGEIMHANTKNITIKNSDFPGQLVLWNDSLANANILLDSNVHHDFTVTNGNREGRIYLPYRSETQPNGITIQNSKFYGGDGDGIQTGGNGTQILNNEFYNLQQGANDAVHTDSIQLIGTKNTVIRGNYFHNVSVGIMCADTCEREIVDNNVFNVNDSPFAITFLSDDSSQITHNTFVDGACSYNLRCGIVKLGNKSGDPVSKGTILKNNILASAGVSNGEGTTTGLATDDYNLYAVTKGAGANNILGKPIYTGGTSPTTYAGFALAADSPGKGKASDGLDIGVRIGASSTTPPPADTTAPTTAITSPANGSTVSGVVPVTASASDNVGVAKVEFYLDGTLKFTDTVSPYNFSFDSTVMTDGTNHTIQTKAYDAASNVAGSAIVTVKVDNSDKTAPSAPTNLRATATSPTATVPTQVNLSWTAATDNVGVNKYYVRRDGVVIATIASGTATSYSDKTVVTSTAYTYQVLAGDAANNTSAASNAASVTTPAPFVATDSTAPSVPANLSAQATSAYQVNLSWTASTDETGGSGLKEYRVFRGTTQVATVAATTSNTPTYADATVSPSTSYSYSVKAADATGNVSAASAIASATTPAPAPVSQMLVGNQTVRPAVDQMPTGQAEAFRSKAVATGSGSSLSLYLDEGSTATKVKVGIYANYKGHPRKLLAQTVITAPKAGAWNAISLPTTSIVSGKYYWMAVLAPSGDSGKVKFRITENGTGKSEGSSQTNLTSLPAKWVSGTNYTSGPLSGYVSR